MWALPEVWALIFTLVLVFSPVSAQNLGDHDVVSFAKTPETLTKLQRLDLDLLMEKAGRIYAVVGVRDLIRLNQELVAYRIETQNFPAASSVMISAQGGINGQFHSYWEVEQELMLLEQTYPAVVKVVGIGNSLEGRNIYAVKISDNASQEEDEAQVIFCGCHHAREWISVEVPLRLAQHLAANYASDPEIRTLLDKSEVWILPLVNPDGLEYSIHVYRYWRKNRRNNGGGSYGIDLNRNYGYQWGHDEIGSSGDPNSAVYRGPAAFSEPESRVVRDFVAAHDFQALVSYHNYSQIILYPWGYTHELSDQDELMRDLSGHMVERMAQVHGRQYAFGPAGESLYTTNGDATDWAYGVYGIPAFTVELPPPGVAAGGFFNSEADIEPIFEENLAAALFLIDWAVQNHQTGQIPGLIQNERSRIRIHREFKK